jgi:hypothetical protein
MKVALERMCLLKRKMGYQIDKLLALSTLGGGAGGGGDMAIFASVGREEADEGKVCNLAGCPWGA